MKRVYILCEGQTEETFVNAVLSPYFTPQGIYVTPVVLATKRIASGGKHKGGVSSYEKISKDLRLLCRDGGAYVTSLLDYFALPEDTPGFSVEAPSLYEHIEMIEQAINQDIGKANCHANLLVHEFEGLLFSAPEEFALIAEQDAVDALCAVREEYPNPEEINSSFDTAPSKRILAVIPDYKKVADGSDLSQVIGIDRMIASCPHFASWIQKIRE
ncbi:MAG: DUF4276 family protein [Clostridiales bacterium]|nr:DUF4276 family protein [Clostridiales bacterium]